MKVFKLETYRAMLHIQKHRLDEEIEIHAELQDSIGVAFAQAEARCTEAEQEAKRASARAYTNLKSNAPSATVQELNARVDLSPELIAAQRTAIRLRQERDEWSSLRDAWKQRGYGLSKMVDLFTAQYFTLSRSQGGEMYPNNPNSVQSEMFKRERALSESRNATAEAVQKRADGRRRLADD